MLPLFGGTAMSLTGSGVTLTNNGTIDLLAGLSVVSNGTVVGNILSPSTVNVTNASTGVMMADQRVAGQRAGIDRLQRHRRDDEHHECRHDRHDRHSRLHRRPDRAGGHRAGGAQVNFTNASGGAINGSVVLAPSGLAGTGNTFTNAGTVTGNVSLGAAVGTSNTFNALTGSSVGLGVDAGLGGNNTLNLQLNTAAGSAANGTVAVDTFGNFTHLAVQAVRGTSTAHRPRRTRR